MKKENYTSAITWAVFQVARHKLAVARKRPPMIQLFAAANKVDGDGCNGREFLENWIGGPL
jgi:hypothetical protein